jgi:hypothetical protein
MINDENKKNNNLAFKASKQIIDNKVRPIGVKTN